MGMKAWNVRVHTGGGSIELGQVRETNEELARCAALSKFSTPEDEDTDLRRSGIRLEDDFDVSLA
jgi:hypothetical protein